MFMMDVESITGVVHARKRTTGISNVKLVEVGKL